MYVGDRGSSFHVIRQTASANREEGKRAKGKQGHRKTLYFLYGLR